MSRLSMVGPMFARHAIHDSLKANFPSVLAELRVEWNVDEDQLPDPVRYVAREPDVLDKWPTIAVTTGVESTTRRVEHGDEGGVYVTTYPIEIYSWINTQGRGGATDMRDMMGTAVKVYCLTYPLFHRVQEDLVLDESTFEQRFSDIQSVKGERFVAGTLTAFDVQVYENTGPFGTQTSPIVERVAVRGYSEGSPFATPEPFPVHPAFE